ncbi:hypothetical protein SLEP1_g55930 [Rubroshorea leprosula]|uniref:Uncharacterized protein n=1 Tax=Rubroshorea leprosula TaxID=152421 RepID=A0AAV5MH27_9ROSI|nr:hypothetical protein SLEP1_g55930 [Rubroshorea leprosula]
MPEVDASEGCGCKIAIASPARGRAMTDLVGMADGLKNPTRDAQDNPEYSYGRLPY